MHASNEGSGESALLYRLARVFAAICSLRSKYGNIVHCTIYHARIQKALSEVGEGGGQL